MTDDRGQTVEALLERGLEELDAGDFTAALASWNEVLRIEPSHARAAALVAELENLITDRRTAGATPASGEFLVVVEDDELSALPGGSPNLISRAALEKLNKLLDRASDTNESLDRQLAEHEAERATLKSELARRDRELADLRERQAALDARVGGLERDRRAAEQFGRLRERHAAELEVKLAERHAFERRTLDELRKANAARQELETTRQQLQTNLNGAHAELEDTRGALEEARRATEAMASTLSGTRGELDRERATTDDLRGEIAQLDTRIAELEAAVGERDAGIAELLATVGERDADIAALSAAQQSEREESEQRISGLNRALEESQSARAAMRSEMATIVNDLETARALQADTEQERDRLSGAVTELQTALAASEGERQQLEAALQSARAEAEAERQRLEAGLESVRAEAEAERQRLEDALEGAGAEVEDANQRTQTAAIERDTAIARERTATAERDAANVELAALRSTNDALQQRAELAEAQVGELETTVAHLTVALHEAQDEDEVARLQGQLDQLRAMLDGAARESRVSGSNRSASKSTSRPAVETPRAGSASADLQHTPAPMPEPAYEAARVQVGAGAHDGDDPHARLGDPSAFRGAAIGDDFGVEVPADSRNAMNAELTPLRPSESAAAFSAGGVFDPDDSSIEELDIDDAMDEISFGGFDESSGDGPAIAFPAPRQATSASVGTSSAAVRLADVSVSASERLAWLVDEIPYISSTDVAPNLSAQAAFVLQNIDGAVSFADLIDIVGLPSDETAEIIVDLLMSGIITSPSLEP